MSSTTSSALTAQTLEGNRLLALLSPDTRRQMLPALKPISLDMGRVLYEGCLSASPSPSSLLRYFLGRMPAGLFDFSQHTSR